jgi:large subunit ribosomal protein L9
MQVILMEKVVNLGGLGDVVKVKDGYARNFLIPQGKAKRATDANRKIFEEKRAELERIQAEAVAAAQGQAEKLEGLMLQITRKTGVDGRLFGSVSAHDIIEALEAQGYKVDKGAVRLPERPAQDDRRHAGTDRAAQRRRSHRHGFRARRAVSRPHQRKGPPAKAGGPFLCPRRRRGRYPPVEFVCTESMEAIPRAGWCAA